MSEEEKNTYLPAASHYRSYKNSLLVGLLTFLNVRSKIEKYRQEELKEQQYEQRDNQIDLLDDNE